MLHTLLLGSLIAVGSHFALAASGDGPTVRELSFKTPDLTLVGMFEAPAGAKSGPALLLLPGSGPTDRDGNSALGIKTDVLKDIADALAQHGVASFRFDKRAIRRYEASWPKTPEDLNHFFGWNKFVEDAKAALEELETQPEVDPKRVGMLGHSEGSLISLQVAADLQGKPEAPKALVLLGGSGRPMGIILHEQIARLLKKQGASDEVAKPFLDYTDSACKALAANQPLPPNTPTGLGPLFNPTVLDIMGAYCRIDPVDLIAKFSGPALVITGANDAQVSAERDAKRMIDALKARPKGSVDSLIPPDASHCLKSTKGGDMDAFSGPIVPGVLDKIESFATANL